MRRFRLAAVAIVAGLASAVMFDGSATVSAASLLQLPRVPATRILLLPVGFPAGVTAQASGTANFLVRVVDWKGTGLPSVKLSLSVLSGPNTGKSATASTDSAGNAPMSYTSGSSPGTDVVQATFTDGLEIHKSNRAFIDWQTGPPAAALKSPAVVRVTPTCFQPAVATQRVSDTFKSVTPKKKTTTAVAEVSSITVAGTDFNPFSAILITFDAGPGGRPQNFVAQTDGFGFFSRDIQVTEPEEGVHIIRADDFREREAQATYRLPCSEGNIALDPPIGPPGFVTMVVGRGFPPNSPITLLNWSRPDLASPFPKSPIKTGGDGSFQFPILILYHDLLGPRTLRAVVQDGNPGEGGALIEADAPFLLTLGRAQPDPLVWRR